ncbi:hypothetical protein MUW33_1804 [Mycobacterium canetti]|uniref:hypothetical protein n=1 Tax=Mycobacterium canetti TaxID=78331 RepID=UPI002D799D49|nr:hypothetical protein [Mycobacterium canetti]WRO41764.1 hypothetical protein MUW33_1804 [Mycobacterium canetti]
MSLSRHELLTRARADRLLLAMLDDDAEALAVVHNEVADDPLALWSIALSLAWHAAVHAAARLGPDGAIAETMCRIALQLDRADS